MNTLKINICYWACISDGCSGQFKSQHSVADLMTSCSKFEFTQVGFRHYVSHEVKNTSDTTGSVVKSALKGGMFKHPEIKIRNDDAVIILIRSQVKERTEQFDFFIVKKFNSFERTPDKERGALEVKKFKRCTV